MCNLQVPARLYASPSSLIFYVLRILPDGYHAKVILAWVDFATFRTVIRASVHAMSMIIAHLAD